MPDSGFLLPLLLPGGVVATVLLQVALFTAGIDFGGDDRTIRDQLVELVLEPVVGILGQPGHLAIAHGHHLLLGPAEPGYTSRPPRHRGWQIQERHGPLGAVPIPKNSTKPPPRTPPN